MSRAARGEFARDRRGLSQSVVQRFERIESLGSGGMGQVFRARDRVLDRDVALKISRSDEPAAVEALEQEFVALSEIRQPGVPEILDFGLWDEDGRCYLTTEFIAGQGLLEMSASFDSEQLIGVAASLLRVLAGIHAQSWVHFDIKAENIRLRPLPRSGGEVACILDFGLAARLRDPGVRSARGTVHSIAPELIREAPWDQRVDLYSLGVCLYRCACGRMPFEGEDARSVLSATLRGGATPASAWRPEIPQALCQLIQGLMATKPEERFGSAAEALEELARMRGEDAPSFPKAPLRGRLTGLEGSLDEALKAMRAGKNLVLHSSRGGSGLLRITEELLQSARRERMSILDARGAALVRICEGSADFQSLVQASVLVIDDPRALESAERRELLENARGLLLVCRSADYSELLERRSPWGASEAELSALLLEPMSAMACDALLASILGLRELPKELRGLAGCGSGGDFGEVERLARSMLSAELVRPYQGFVDLAGSRALMACWCKVCGAESVRLSEEAWALLCAVAASPPPGAGLPDPWHETELDACVGRVEAELVSLGLIQREGGGLRFCVPSFRSLLRELVPEDLWRGWHARGAALISPEAESLESLEWRARCVLESGALPDSRFWRRVAEQAMRRAETARARDALERALAVVAPESRERGEIALQLAELWTFEGRLSRAAAVLAWSPDESGPSAARRRLLWAEIELGRARFESARAAFGEMLAQTEPSEDRILACLGLTRVALHRGDYWAAIALADKAGEAGAEASEASWYRGLAEYYLGDPERASPRLAFALEVRLDSALDETLIPLREALRVAPVLQSPFSDAYGLISLSAPGEALAVLSSRLDLAEAQAERGARAARSRGDRAALALALSNHSVYARLRGDLSLALAESREALAIYEGLDDRHGATMALCNLAGLYALVGRVERCAAAAEQVLARAREGGLSWLQGQACLLLAQASKLSGEVELCARLLQRAQGAFSMINNRRNECSVIYARAELALERGHGVELRSLLREAQRLSPKPEPSDLEARRMMAQAGLLLRESPEEAAGILEDALVSPRRPMILELELKLRRQLQRAYEAMAAGWLAREQSEEADRLCEVLLRGLSEDLKSSARAVWC